METYTIKKSELIDFYNKQINKNKSLLKEKIKLPNEELNIRVPKSGIVNFIAVRRQTKVNFSLVGVSC